MALARIFSRYPEQTTTLAEQLEQQGYKVEVLSPDEAPTTLADLEIQLEACDPADVLRRAAELASQLHADIAIAPGALPASSPAEETAYTPANAAPEANEPPILPAAMEAEPSNDAPAHEARPNRLAQAGRASGTALAALAASTGKFLTSARAAFRERLEQARVLAAEANERRQQRLLDLAHRRAEARQHAVALESSRRALAVYLLHLQRDCPDVVPDAGDKPTPATEPPLGAWRARIRALHMNKWEAVLAGAVSAVALFAAGLAVASFHSRPALTPGGGVTLHSGGVTLPAPQAKAAARPSPAARKTTAKAAAQARSTRRMVPPRRPSHRNDDIVARDVVVRHYTAPKSPPPRQADGWKHFSDESN